MTTSTVTDSAGLSVYKATSTVGTGKSEMGQEDFLRLLTAQMQTQDPFEPVDNAEMVSQMATITNSSGIAEMNANLASIKEQLSGTRIGDAASWIGRSMLVQSNIAAPDASGLYAGQITLPAAVDGASVDLVDASGNVVKSIDLGSQPAGDVSFYWDGKDDTGATVSTAALQVKVNGATPSKVATWATIAAVQSPADGSSSKLITALGTYSPSDALSLS
ncbi:MAG: flagellar hook capping protein [Sphingobium sp.]|nr:flagellar hook capping protein [Sphingobium sp.]